MKRYLLILAAAFALSACQEKPVEPEGPSYPVPEAGTAYLLEGTVNTEGFTWKTNSVVGLYSAMDEIKIINKECKIEGWANTDPVIDPETGENTNIYTPSEYEGKATGRFNTPQLDLVQGENKFMVYSPYNPDLSFVNGVIYGLSIGDEQVQNAPNAAADCFSFGIATGIPGVDEAFSFSLNPVTALAQVSITTSTLGKFAPKKVTIYDDSGTAMAGGFNIDINSMEITPVGTPLDRVSVEVTNATALETTATQNIYLNILPADYAGKELWVVVELVDEAGATLTIPVKKGNLKFEAGKVTKIDLAGLSTEMNAAGAWYNATETRLLPGNGVAYGDANTYFIQCKNGSTYTGATYTPNADIPDEVTIDYRARGNFYNAVAPEGVTFELVMLNSTTPYTGRTAGYGASGVVLGTDAFTINHNEAEKTVTVKNVSAFAGTPILKMMKDGKALWSWTFWNVAADGTSIDPVTIGGYQFAPMDIGQPTTDFEKWSANMNGTKPDVPYRFTHFYQWGRPTPVFWTSYWSAANTPQVVGRISFADAITNPGNLITNLGAADKDNWIDWCTDADVDFWGTNDQKKEGAKTIYDPCPKGWRIASVPALNALVNNKATATYNETAGQVSAKLGDLLLVIHGYQTAKISTDGGRPSNMGLGDNGSTGHCKEAMLWANVAGKSQGVSLHFTSSGYGGTDKLGKNDMRIATFNRSHAAAIRCIVDNDNR